MNTEFMRMAIDLAKQKMEQGEGGPFGAVIIRDRKVIATGWNRVTSANDPTAHAEVEAIRNACRQLGDFQLTGCELYTSCEPCPMCFGAIAWARPDRVYYATTREDAAKIGFDDAMLYNELKKDPEMRALPYQQIMREQALPLFEIWSKKTDKIEY